MDCGPAAACSRPANCPSVASSAASGILLMRPMTTSSGSALLWRELLERGNSMLTGIGVHPTKLSLERVRRLSGANVNVHYYLSRRIVAAELERGQGPPD